VALGTLTAVNVLVQTSTAMQAVDVNSSKVPILLVPRAAVVVTAVFLVHVVVGTEFANAITGLAVQAALVAKIFLLQMHVLICGI